MTNLDTILKRLVADIDDAMEMQGTRWSSNERVAGLVQEALEQATRLIQVLYATEMSSLDQEIVSLKAKQPPVESLDSILEDTHRIGLHSDDRGGDSDKPCYCMVKPALQRLIQTSNRESYKKGYNAGRMKHMWRKYHKPARVHKNICPVCKQIQTLTKEEE